MLWGFEYFTFSVGISRYSFLITLSVCVVRWCILLLFFSSLPFAVYRHHTSQRRLIRERHLSHPRRVYTHFILHIKETEYNLVLADATIAATATASMTMKCTFSFHSFTSTYTSIMTGGIRQIYTKLHLINSPPQPLPSDGWWLMLLMVVFVFLSLVNCHSFMHEVEEVMKKINI